MEYGFKTYKKIDVFIKLIDGNYVYMHSTNACRTCKDAIYSAFKRYKGNIYKNWDNKNDTILSNIKQLKANFDKNR